MRKINLPEEKLNELAQQISERMLSNHFFKNGIIRGEELKNFSEHTQINKFLIFQVFQVWDMQIAKLKHPFFDFEQADIKESLKALKNKLSQHIRINEADFKPMLNRAVYNNLRLLLSPRESLESFFFNQGDKLPFETYQRYAQFFSDLGFIVSSILKYYQKNNLDTVEKDVYFLKMDKVVEVYNKKSDKDFDTYRAELFESLSGMKLNSIVSELEAEAEAKKREEEEARRREEEERRREEEEKRRQEEEARKKEEEEAKRREEEERRKKEQAQKTSFFDTIESDDDFDLDLDLDLDMSEEKAETPVAVEEEVEEETPVVEEPVLEETPVEEPAFEETVMEEPVVEETIAEEPVAESRDEFMEMAESMEPVAESKKEVETSSSVVEEVLGMLDSKPEVQSEPEPDPVAEAPSPEVMEKPAEKTGEKESTVSFLDRFLNENENGKVTEPKAEKSASILDKITETAAKTTGDVPRHVLDKLNGSRKIKLDEIPIHKQYQYVQKVFDGNNVRFRIIVDKVNNAKNKEEVEDILDKFVLNNDSLDQSDNVVSEFIDMLRNRF